MDSSPANLSQVATTSKRIAHQLFTIGENRLELLVLELQEERDRFLHALWLTLGMAVFGLLVGFTLTALIVVMFWESWPIGVLAVLTGVYAGVAGFLYSRLVHLRRAWQTFPATLDQLRKDRECLTKPT